MTVGQIVADKFDNSEVFNDVGIDFCCGGEILLSEACSKKGLDIDFVLDKLDNVEKVQNNNLDFKNWDIDLLVDYILKFHHRYVRKNSIKIQELLNKVVGVHGDNHKSLHDVKKLFDESVIALNEHLDKEEQVLFPYIYEMNNAKENNASLPYFHCDSIQYPIDVMTHEHSEEGERFKEISKLTNDYTPPSDACNSYKLLLEQLKEFEDNLHHHIHLENNIVFPRALEMQSSYKS